LAAICLCRLAAVCPRRLAAVCPRCSGCDLPVLLWLRSARAAWPRSARSAAPAAVCLLSCSGRNLPTLLWPQSACAASAVICPLGRSGCGPSARLLRPRSARSAAMHLLLKFTCDEVHTHVCCPPVVVASAVLVLSLLWPWSARLAAPAVVCPVGRRLPGWPRSARAAPAAICPHRFGRNLRICRIRAESVFCLVPGGLLRFQLVLPAAFVGLNHRDALLGSCALRSRFPDIASWSVASSATN
jgi:hypothetical protein